MLKKSITYTTFNDERVTEEFYFHLSKSDIVKLNFSKDGGLEAWVRRVQATEDVRAVLAELEKIVLSSYGKKSDDGKRFVKSPELLEEFKASNAWDELFFGLISDAASAAEFINGLIPADMVESTGAQTELDRVRALAQADRERAGNIGAPAEPQEKNVFEENATRVLTQAEVIEMPAEELKSGLATGRYRLPN